MKFILCIMNVKNAFKVAEGKDFNIHVHTDQNLKTSNIICSKLRKGNRIMKVL